jgi:hypothetical protein
MLIGVQTVKNWLPRFLMEVRPPAPAGSVRPWCHPHGAHFAGIQNTRVLGLLLDCSEKPGRPDSV